MVRMFVCNGFTRLASTSSAVDYGEVGLWRDIVIHFCEPNSDKFGSLPQIKGLIEDKLELHDRSYSCTT